MPYIPLYPPFQGLGEEPISAENLQFLRLYISYDPKIKSIILFGSLAIKSLYIFYISSNESEAGAPLCSPSSPLSDRFVQTGLLPRAAQKIRLRFLPARNISWKIKPLLDTIKKIRFWGEYKVFAKFLKIQLLMPYIPLYPPFLGRGTNLGTKSLISPALHKLRP